MVRALEMDEIAGFCVGEPWNGLAVDLGLGVSLISSYEIWNNAMEKVLAMTEAWHLRHPQTTLALTRAVVRACRWLEKPRHRELAAILLSRADYVDVPQQVLEPALMGVRPHRPGEHGIPQPEFLVFGRSAANFPWRSQGLWYGEQMRIRGQLPPNVDVSAVVERSYRPDVFREAVAEIDMPVPTIDYKAEGVQHHAWTLQEATAPSRWAPTPSLPASDLTRCGRPYISSRLDEFTKRCDGFRPSQSPCTRLGTASHRPFHRCKSEPCYDIERKSCA
ncbi:hypothetical protein CAL65_05900 [Alkalilimnicola ehrlichii]|uniref:Uncharacterized protein n=1 Tax=Alkalilimnicola ehrlichii TaxID=351052 RepID=A0A3E0WZS5_9GAMM|nr:hypothetical protein CAL65_05900 [Alkalilimnicola ehrlichii]